MAVPNVGVLGSHGASAVPLLATLVAWGKAGLAARIERCVDLAAELAQFVRQDSRMLLLAEPQSGIVVWRPKDATLFDKIRQSLPSGSASMTTLGGERWFRNVAANPNADVRLLQDKVREAMVSAQASG